MKTHMMVITALVVVLSLPLALYAQESDPEAVVRALAEQVNAGDLDATMAYWDSDPVMEVVHLDTTYTGLDEVRGLFEMLLGMNFEMHIDQVLKVEGDTVTTRTLMDMDDTRALGVQVVSTQVYVVRDGKIKSLWCSWTDETLAALAAAGPTSTEALSDIGIEVESVVSSSYGTFNGVDYMKHAGRFWGTTARDYSVAFEIIAPADPTQGNGALLLELLHPMGAPFARDAYLTPEFLFGHGFSHATIGWHAASIDPYEGYSIEDAVEIVHNFALALRQDAEAKARMGNLQQLYAVGVSKSCEPLHSLLYTPGRSLLDFTLLLVPTWFSETYEQPHDTGLVMEFLTESDLVRAEALSAHTDLLRGSSPTYRSYEVAGAPHVPDVPMTRAMATQMGVVIAGTLDWSPVARALFIAGHRWATEGIEPPPSATLAQAPAGELDSIYQSRYGLALETGIARDANGNALGGIRPPDVELGRVLQIARDPNSIGPGWLGAFVDLKCEPLPDGSPRFQNHAAYVSQFTQQADRLVAEDFLLPEDAKRMIAEADKSDVGDPSACLPAVLADTGVRGRSGPAIPFNLLTALALIALGLGLHRWTGALRWLVTRNERGSGAGGSSPSAPSPLRAGRRRPYQPGRNRDEAC